MKYIYFALFINVFAISCSSRLPKLIRCTSQQWSVGANNSSGTVYHIVIKASADTLRLKIDSLYLSNHIITDFKLSVLGQSNLSSNYRKGDSILISLNHQDNKGVTEKINKYTVDGKNVIYYSLNKKKHFLRIDPIKVLTPLL